MEVKQFFRFSSSSSENRVKQSYCFVEIIIKINFFLFLGGGGVLLHSRHFAVYNHRTLPPACPAEIENRTREITFDILHSTRLIPTQLCLTPYLSMSLTLFITSIFLPVQMKLKYVWWLSVLFWDRDVWSTYHIQATFLIDSVQNFRRSTSEVILTFFYMFIAH